MPQRSDSAATTRKDRLIHERVHDPYKSSSKFPEPTVCPVCGAIYQEGRWRWINHTQMVLIVTTCQACRRIRDRYPAGILR